MIIAQQKSCKTDIQIIHVHHNVGKYFGLTTALSEESHKKLWKWYLPILMLSFVACAAYNIAERVIAYNMIVPNVTYLGKTLEGATFATNTIYIGICLLGSLFGRKKWNVLFTNVDTAEKLLPKNFVINGSVRLFKIVTAIYHLVLLILHLSDVLYSLNHAQQSAMRFSLLFKTSMYCQTFDAILIFLFNQMLRRRYDCLNRMVFNSTVRNVSIGVILREEEEKSRVRTIRKVFSVYQLLDERIEKLNDIFGWKIYFILQNTLLTLLSTFNCIVIDFKEQRSFHWKKETVYVTFFTTVFTIIAATLVMSCNGVEESGRKITTTCYMRLANLEKSAVRDELLILAKCTEQLQPKMSAAGFFTLNQATLTSMFSFVTTYLIIVIQFNLL